MSIHNNGFYEEMTKTIFQLSSNTHFICSSGKKMADILTTKSCNILTSLFYFIEECVKVQRTQKQSEFILCFQCVQTYMSELLMIKLHFQLNDKMVFMSNSRKIATLQYTTK